MTMENQIFSVSELNRHIRSLLSADSILSDICVSGELSNYKIYPSGHHYFTLKDADDSLKCVMFRTSASHLRFRPENGMSVIAFGRVDVYGRDGVYQLYCNGIMPMGTGDLQIAFEQLKKKLSAEGLFDPNHKKPLPEYPKTIGIITSSAGAALHDMLKILNRRWPLCRVILLPVRVQGAEAPGEIASAIRYANEFSVADLLITGRGGGSIEDLWAFNDEGVARAIYDSEIPVISAVGHEPDVTISDYVADARASTPSNAAEIAVPDQEEMQERLNGYCVRMNRAMTGQIFDLRERLSYLSRSRVLTDASVQLDDRRIQLDRIRESMIAAEERLLSADGQRLASAAAALDAMSPMKVLMRGYAIACDEQGGVIKEAESVKVGDSVQLKLSRGRLACRVNEIIKD